MTRVQRARHRGFTLIEIMVVVVIIGLLTAVVTTQVVGRIDEARVTKARQDLKQLEFALQMYRMDNSRYPTTEQGLQALVMKPEIEPVPHNWKQDGYLARASKDPWKNDYVYASPGTDGRPYDLWSLGADQREGGEEIDADISVWDLDE